jgi:hypothetical protein
MNIRAHAWGWRVIAGDRPRRRRSRGMVDPMTRRGGPRRTSALLLAATFIATGCGSATGASAGPSTTTRSGILGDAVARVCGGASSGGQGCRNRPVPATVVVVRLPSHATVATVHTDSRGGFRLHLPPGRYQLRARTSNQQLWARVLTARVRSHQMTRATVVFVPRHPLPLSSGAPSG